MSKQASRGQWTGRFGFILAAVGSAVGLGNIWKFPYITGVSGGGAFVLFYIFCIIVVGLPIIFAEILIGRDTQLSPVSAFKALKKGPWWTIGALGVLSGLFILSFYSIVAGWTLHFLFLSIKGLGSSENVKGLFDSLRGDPSLNILWHSVFMVITIGVVIGGVRKGIERVSKTLMPLLFVLMAIMMVVALSGKGAAAGVAFLFKPDFSKLTLPHMLEAIGHAFFTLSLGMGAMITYGSYLRKETRILPAGGIIAVMDTVVALMAGLIIFPVVFSFGMAPNAGPGLIFKTLPSLFVQMNGGQIFAIAFFVLLFFAALTSAISLLEVVVSFSVDDLKMKRWKSTLIIGTLIWLLGIPSGIASLKIWGWGSLDFFDELTTNYMLPLGGICISLFVGWGLSDRIKEGKALTQSPVLRSIILVLLKVVSPLLVTMVLISKVITTIEKHPVMGWTTISIFLAIIISVVVVGFSRKKEATS